MPEAWIGNETSALCVGLAGRPQWKQSQQIWQHYPLQNQGFTASAWTGVPVHAQNDVPSPALPFREGW
eukprot:3128808-Amphidinium_carterae.1